MFEAAFERAAERDGRAGAEETLDSDVDLVLDIVSIGGSGCAVVEDDIVEVRSSDTLLAANGAGTVVSAMTQRMFVKDMKEDLRGTSRSHGFRGEGILKAQGAVAQIKESVGGERIKEGGVRTGTLTYISR